MKTLADLINAMDFTESLELAKEICDSRLAGILAEKNHVKRVVKMETATQESSESVYDSNKTRQVLIQLGIKPSNKGFKYIEDSVKIVFNDPSYLDKVTALYYKVGNMNNSTDSRVERAIRHSLQDLKGKLVYEILPVYPEHCTNKEFLSYLIMYLSK